MSYSTSRFFSFLFLGASLLRDVAVKTMEDVKTLLLEISTVVRTVHSIFHEYCDVISEKLKLKLSFECNNTFFLVVFIARIISILAFPISRHSVHEKLNVQYVPRPVEVFSRLP